MTTPVPRDDRPDALDGPFDGEQLILSDLINRVLDKGVVISSQITISIADIDLIAIDLRLLITGIATAAAAARGRDPRRG